MVAAGIQDPYITGAFPNVIELRSMWEFARSDEGLISSLYWWQVIDTFGPDLHRSLSTQIRGDMLFLVNDGIIQMATQLVPFIKHIVVKCGSKGKFPSLIYRQLCLDRHFRSRVYCAYY
jgi:pseudouridine-5'-phosphate glycosidase/pseudouridine kinase